jgi:hypothetical protein
MTESYADKKARLQRVLESLDPPILRTQVPLRNTEGISKLPQQARDLLAQCLLEKAKISFPKAIQVLNANPGVSHAEFLKLIARAKPGTSEKAAVDPDDAEYVAKVIYKCFPHMEENSVRGIAASDSMSEARNLAAVLQDANTSGHLRSDFVVVVIYAMLLGALDDMVKRIREVPAFVEAVKRTKLPLQDK